MAGVFSCSLLGVQLDYHPVIFFWFLTYVRNHNHRVSSPSAMLFFICFMVFTTWFRNVTGVNIYRIVKKRFDASPRSGPRLICQTLASIWVAVRRRLCRLVRATRDFQSFIPLFVNRDWVVRLSYWNLGTWVALDFLFHTIIQSSNSSWSLRPGEIISRPPPNTWYNFVPCQ